MNEMIDGMSPAAPSPPTETISSSPLNTSVRCIQCVYNLLGLSEDGVCPECGTPIVNSTRGTMLAFSSPDYTKKLHDGVFTIQAAIIAWVLVFMASMLIGILAGGRSAGPGWMFTTVSLVISIVLWVVSLYGWWRFSEPDPQYAGKDVGDSPRRFIRITAVIRVAIALAALPLSFLGTGSAMGAQSSSSLAVVIGMGVGFVNLVVMLIWFIASMLYIKWLGARLPSHRIVKRAKLLLWLCPVLSVFGIVLLGLGPLIALVLFWNLLDWVRKDLKRIRADQARVVAQV
jgi:hypothetical protein